MEVLCTFESSQSYPRGTYDLNKTNLQWIYTCKIENQVIHEDEELKFIGQHLHDKTNIDVNIISFKLCYITKVPKDLLTHFPNLHSLEIYGSNLKVLNKDDLINFKHFKSFNFDSNQIEFLPDDLFEGFKNLERVSFKNNNLRVIEPTIFDGLTNLQSIELRCNSFIMSDYCPRSKSEILENLKKAYFARSKFLSDVENLRKECQELKITEMQKTREITELKELLENEKLKKSNLNFPHHSCFCKELKETLQDENSFKDFTIMIENEEFQVNKLLLAVRSPVLAKILRDNPNTHSFNLVDISVQTFKEILKYLYTDKLQLDEISNSMDLFAAAHRLKINKLKYIAAMDISNKMTPENALEILFLSNKCEHDKLRQNSFNEVKKKYPKIEFKDEWTVQPDKMKIIVDGYKIKEEKLQKIEMMIENIEQQFQNLLT